MISPAASHTPHSQRESGGSIRRTILAAIVGGLLVGAILLALRPGGRPAPAEVDRAELTLIDGRLHGKGESVPFTGFMIERYPDGLLQSRTSVSNGLLEGLSEGWYTNGQRQVLEHFQAGVSHGQRVKWYANGVKLSEANIVQGKIEGVFRRWHDNGVLAEEIPMKAGQPDGLSRAYYSNGRLKAEARLRAGQVLEQKFWEDNANHLSAGVQAFEDRPTQSGP